MSHRLHNRSFHSSTRTLIRVLLFTVALAATALGCAWINTPNSVRFNYHQSERELGRLPPLPTLANGSNTLREFWESEDFYGDDNYTLGEEHSDAIDELWNQTEVFEKDGDLKQERDRLLEYLRRTCIRRDIWFNPTDREPRRNAAIDKLDALTALDRGSSSSRVEAYLTARTLFAEAKPFQEVEGSLATVASDPNLRDNVAYLKAANLYREEKFEEAVQAFRAVSRKYPNSEKREASLFMTALATLKTSLAYTPTSGDEAHLHEGEDSENRHAVEIDDAWHAALAGFKRVTAEYPRGRYYNDARGWIAYLMLRKNDRAAALVEYYRLLSDQGDENARVEAAFSLELVRHHATDSELSGVESELADEPRVALTYAYHNIFNYSIDPGSSYPPNEESEREWSSKRASTGRQTVQRVLAFSRRLMDRYPGLAIGGAFALRAAEASVELDNNEDAVRFAQRALQNGVQNNERAQALWTIGVAEHRLQHFPSARKNLERLIHDYPNNNLVEGARRLLAMVAEDCGDLDTALEQYLALKYRLDIAYFVDVLMTIEQLAQFIDSHSDIPEKNELTYSLGVRYLRANLWNAARTTFAKVRAAPLSESSMYSNRVRCPFGRSENEDCINPKEPEWDEAQEHTIITDRLLMLDVQTANDLERLEKAVAQATTDETAAEALYQLASYQYEATSLLFYNPVLWIGSRYQNLSYLEVESRYRRINESQLLFAYMQEHDTLARALKVYLKVVEMYPQTRAARDALYTAAVCHERLSDYNDYWRDIYGAGLHAGQRKVTYRDVKAAYPTYQLPRGTYGWQPSTRTVNDGPGWDAPPKYVPPPSRWVRLKWKVEHVFTQVQVFWNEKVRRLITMIFLLFGVGFTARIAAQNRKLLRPKFVRVRLAAPNRTIAQPWTTLFWKGSCELGPNEKIRQFLTERGIEFWELARDRGSRPILLRNIFSHSFLAALVIGLFWFLHFG